jgi:hypothetical protein
MNQPVTRDLRFDIRCAAALLCQHAALPINLVKRDGHCCHLRAQTKAEGSLARIAASPTCVRPDKIKAQTKIVKFMEERRSTLVLEFVCGQQFSANASVCSAEAQNFAYGKMRAG